MWGHLCKEATSEEHRQAGGPAMAYSALDTCLSRELVSSQSSLGHWRPWRPTGPCFEAVRERDLDGLFCPRRPLMLLLWLQIPALVSG